MTTSTAGSLKVFCKVGRLGRGDGECRGIEKEDYNT